MAITFSEVTYTAENGIDNTNYGTVFKGVAQAIANAAGLTLTETTQTATNYVATARIAANDNVFIRFNTGYSGGGSAWVGSLSACVCRQKTASSTADLTSQQMLFSLKPRTGAVQIKFSLTNIEDLFFIVTPITRESHIDTASPSLCLGKLINGATEYNCFALTQSSSITNVSHSVYYLQNVIYVDSNYTVHYFTPSPMQTEAIQPVYNTVFMMPYRLYCQTLSAYATIGGKYLYTSRYIPSPDKNCPAFITEVPVPFSIGGATYYPVDMIYSVRAAEQVSS